MFQTKMYQTKIVPNKNVPNKNVPNRGKTKNSYPTPPRTQKQLATQLSSKI